MSESQMLDLIKAFLAGRVTRPLSDQATAWEDFFRIHDPIIRAVVAKYHMRRHDLDDVTQEVWKVLIRELPKLRFDPVRGSLRNWVATVARHTAAPAGTATFEEPTRSADPGIRRPPRRSGAGPGDAEREETD